MERELNIREHPIYSAVENDVRAYSLTERLGLAAKFEPVAVAYLATFAINQRIAYFQSRLTKPWVEYIALTCPRLNQILYQASRDTLQQDMEYREILSRYLYDLTNPEDTAPDDISKYPTLREAIRDIHQKATPDNPTYLFTPNEGMLYDWSISWKDRFIIRYTGNE